MADAGQQLLDEAFARLQQQSPDRICRAICWLRDPKARPVRLPLGLLLIVASFFWFLPVLGLEMLPMGLLLIAQDVPVLRQPVGRVTLWVADHWLARRRRPDRAGGCR